MPPPVLAYLIVLPTFLVLDAIWLTLMAPRLYKPTLGPMLLDPFALTPALLFYLLYGVGLVVFAVMPGLAGKGPLAFGYGALFGLVAYGTYNLTNLATLKGWTGYLSALDMAWGATGTGLATLVTVVALHALGR